MAIASRERKLSILMTGKDAVTPMLRGITAGFRMIRNVGTAAIRALLAPFRLLGRAIRALLSPMGLVHAAIGFLAARGLVRFVEGTAQMGDEIEKLSQRLGVTVADLNVLKFASGQTGSSLQAAANGFKQLNRQADEASRGLGTARDDFTRLGIELLDAEGNMRPTMDLFEDIAARFEQMPDGARKTAAAMRIFGRSGADMIPMLNQGRSGMQGFREEVERLGVAMTEGQSRLSRDFLDALDRFRTALRGIRQQVGFELFPMLINRLNAVTEWLVRVRPLVVAGANAFANIVSGIGEVGRAIAEWFSEDARMDIERMAETIRAFGERVANMFRGVAAAFGQGDLGEEARRVLRLMVDRMREFGLAIADAFVSGFAAGITDGLPAIGRLLSAMWDRHVTSEMLVLKQRFLTAIRDILPASTVLDKAVESAIQERIRIMGRSNQEIIERFKDDITSFGEDAADIFNESFDRMGQAGVGVVAALERLADIGAKAFDDISKSVHAAEQSIPPLAERLTWLERFFNGVRDSAQQWLTNFEDVMSFGRRAFSTLASSIESSFGTAFDSVVDGTEKLSRAFRRMVADILRQMGRLFAQRAVMALFAGALSTLGVSAAGAEETGIPPLLQAARGAVVQNGQHIERFAQGGVVHSPTFFPMRGRRAGLMGEAGPEAIMPLTRTASGELGVRAENAGETMNVTVNLTVQALDGRSAVQVLNQPETRRAIGDIFAGELQKRRGLRESVRNA